jgi:hypothetical protein
MACQARQESLRSILGDAPAFFGKKEKSNLMKTGFIRLLSKSQSTWKLPPAHHQSVRREAWLASTISITLNP